METTKIFNEIFIENLKKQGADICSVCQERSSNLIIRNIEINKSDNVLYNLPLLQTFPICEKCGELNKKLKITYVDTEMLLAALEIYNMFPEILELKIIKDFLELILNLPTEMPEILAHVIFTKQQEFLNL